MLPRSLNYEREFLSKGAGAEEEDHDKRVREADFCAIDGAVAGAFEDSEVFCICGVQDYLSYWLLLSSFQMLALSVYTVEQRVGKNWRLSRDWENGRVSTD